MEPSEAGNFTNGARRRNRSSGTAVADNDERRHNRRLRTPNAKIRNGGLDQCEYERVQKKTQVSLDRGGEDGINSTP